MTELQLELESKVRNLKAEGKRNYLLAYILYAVAALSSGTATILTAALAATKTPPPTWIPALVSAPVLAVVLNETLRPELKARWCYEKRAAVEAILRSSRYAGTSDSEVAAKWNEVDSKMEREWPRFGTMPSITGQLQDQKRTRNKR